MHNNHQRIWSKYQRCSRRNPPNHRQRPTHPKESPGGKGGTGQRQGSMQVLPQGGGGGGGGSVTSDWGAETPTQQTHSRRDEVAPPKGTGPHPATAQHPGTEPLPDPRPTNTKNHRDEIHPTDPHRTDHESSKPSTSYDHQGSYKPSSRKYYKKETITKLGHH